MYQPYPASGPAPEPERVPPPRNVLTAVRLMYAAAAIEVIGVVVFLVSRGSLKSTILSRHPGDTAAQLHTAEIARTVPLIIGAIIAVALWLWMAWANRQGRNWARVVSAVLFGISTLDLIVGIVVAKGAVASQIVGVVIWLMGLAVILLIFSKQSSPYYQPRAPAR
jgi:hypothetical protein